MSYLYCFFFFKQKTAYYMRISDWSSDVCSSDLITTRSAPTAVLATDRQRRKRLLRHCRLPVPLRSTSRRRWQRRGQCTNNQRGPLSGGLSADRKSVV